MWLLCPAGSPTRVVRGCLTCPIMNFPAVAAQGLSSVCWDLFSDIWAEHSVGPAVTTEGCQPNKAVVWHQCDNRAEHFSSRQRCTAPTSAFRLRNSSHLSMNYNIYSCFGVESRVNKAVSVKSLILVNGIEEGKHSWHYGFISL